MMLRTFYTHDSAPEVELPHTALLEKLSGGAKVAQNLVAALLSVQKLGASGNDIQATSSLFT